MGQVVAPDVCDPQSDASLDALIGLTLKSADWTERDARYMVDKIDQLIDADTWQRRLMGEPKTWERFCCEVLGYPDGYIDAIRSGVAVLESVGVDRATVGEALTVAQRAVRWQGDPQPTLSEAMRGKRNAARDRISRSITTANSVRDADYLTRRIVRDRPDVADRMKAGEFKSVRAAALEAGIVKPVALVRINPERPNPEHIAKVLRETLSAHDIARLIDALQHAPEA